MSSGEIDGPASGEDADEEGKAKGYEDARDMIWIGTKELLHFKDPECAEGVKIDATESQNEQNGNDNSLRI